MNVNGVITNPQVLRLRLPNAIKCAARVLVGYAKSRWWMATAADIEGMGTGCGGHSALPGIHAPRESFATLNEAMKAGLKELAAEFSSEIHRDQASRCRKALAVIKQYQELDWKGVAL